MTTLDPQAIKKDFPILDRKIRGQPLIYLDNAATTQKPHQVIESIVDYYQTYNSNIHRSVHTLGQEATTRYEESRQTIAQFINSPSPDNLIFVRNATEGLNLIAHSWAKSHLKPSDEILVTQMEHHSNLVPWQQVSKQIGCSVKFIPITPEGTLDLSNIDSLITEKTRLISIAHMSNALGTINPIEQITELGRKVGAFICIDGAQSVPHLKTDVQKLDCDFLVFSGHKMLGPTGIGVIYIKSPTLESMEPFLFGGEMVNKVTYEDATWNALPMKFEAGTPNIADAIGLGAAVKYLNDIGMDNIRKHEIALTSYALDAFKELEEIEVYGPQDPTIRGGIITFNSTEIHPHDMGTALDQLGIAIRAGHHCAMPLATTLGLHATERASFYLYNTQDDIDHLINGVKKTLDYFSHGPRRSQ